MATKATETGTRGGWTAGPWEVLPSILSDGTTGPQIEVRAKDGTVVAFNVFLRDARLIALAPEMAEALRALVECPDYRDIRTHEMNTARDLLARLNAVKP